MLCPRAALTGGPAPALTALPLLSRPVPGCADDAVGLDQVVEPWIEGLWSPLKRVVHGDGGDAESSSSEADPGKAEGGGGEEPDPRPAAQEQGPASGKEGAGVRKEAAGLGSSVAKALANNPVEGVGPTPVEYPFATWESLPQVGQEGGVQRWEALLPSLKGVEDVKPLLTGRIMAPPPQPGCAIDVEEGAGDGIGVDTAAAEAGSVATAEQGRVADPLRSPGPAVPAPEGVGEEVRAEWARRRVDSVPSRSSRLEAVRQPTTALEGPGFSAEGAVPVEVDDAWYLTSRTSGERRVVHVELRVGDFGAKWSPGDSFGLFCPNPDAVVSATVAHLGLGDAERQRVVVRGEAPAGSPAARLQAVAGGSCSVADALRWHVDLVSLPRKKFLRLLADRCGDALDKARLLLLTHRGGREAFGSVVEGQRPTLPELLSLFPSCQPTLADLLAHGLQPSARFYSAASSPLADPQRVSLAFSVVAYSTDSGVKRLGVCTTWLERALWPRMRSHRQAVADHPPSAATGVWVRTFLKPSREFAPPADPQRPMVLIGPGTGVAPFRGFLEHRVWKVCAPCCHLSVLTAVSPRRKRSFGSSGPRSARACGAGSGRWRGWRKTTSLRARRSRGTRGSSSAAAAGTSTTCTSTTSGSSTSAGRWTTWSPPSPASRHTKSTCSTG